MSDGAGFREVTLPSHGILYDGRIPSGVVRIRPMTVSDEKLMFSSKSSPAAVFDEIIERCLLTKDVALGDYLLGDKYFILLMLRIDSYGPVYTYKFTCPSCGVKQEVEMQLADCLKVNTLADDFKEPLEFELPMSKRKILYKLLRVSNEREFDRISKDAKLKGRDPIEELYLSVRSRRIVAIDGNEVSPYEAMQFCDAMLPGDGRAFDEEVARVEVIPDFSGEVECKTRSCGAAIPFRFQMDAEFFRSGHARVGGTK